MKKRNVETPSYTSFEKVEIKIDRLIEKGQLYEDKFDEIYAKLSHHDNRFDDHDRRFDDHDKRFDILESKLDLLIELVKNVTSRVDLIDKRTQILVN